MSSRNNDGDLLIMLVAVLFVAFLFGSLFRAMEPPAHRPPAYPTVLPPPVMGTATPPAHAVYAPSIERGN